MPTTHVIADLVRQQTTTTGTGTLSLGTVPAGCRGVVVGIGDGKKARYKLSASDGGWEIGLGTVTDASPDTFSRDVVYASSAGGTTKITLPAGTHTLDVTLDAKSANEMTPRLLNIGNGVTLSSGTLTVDYMGSCDALAVVVLTDNVTTVVMSNLPERAAIEMWVTHSGGPWTFPQNAWPAGTTLHGSYNLYTDGTVTRFWWTTTDAGATSILECNAPVSGGVTNGDAHDHSGGDGGQIAYSSLSGLPTLGSAAAQNTSAFEPAGSVSSHAALTTTHGISAFGATLVDDVDAAQARATLGIGASISDGSTLATGLTFPNTGLKLLDTDGSHALTVAWGSNDTADRTLTITVAGGNRTLTLSNSTCAFTALLHQLGQAGAVTANTIPYINGSSAGALATVTAAAITLLAAASAVAQRSIIESAAPSAVTVATSITLTKAAHQGKVLYCTTAALNITVDASTDFDAYASCEIVNKTGAVVTFVATATINRIGGKPLTLPANGRATLMAEATADVYLLTGEMA